MYNPQIKTFIAVADAGSFNKAAEALFISSTAVIKQMNLLENNIGTPLFERSHKGLSLTAAGKVLYKESKKIIQFSEDALKRVHRVAHPVSNIIRIGSSLITPVNYFVERAGDLQRINDHLKMQIVPFENNPENARRIMDSLGDEIDVLMGFYDEGTKKLYQKAQAITVEHPSVRLIMPLHDELASKELVTWKDLKGRTLHLIRPGWGSTMDAIRQDIMVNHPEITIETFQFFKTQAINDCLSQGDIIVGFDLWNTLNPFAAIRPMDWDYSMEYGLIYSPEPSEAVLEFVEALEELLKEEMQ